MVPPNTETSTLTEDDTLALEELRYFKEKFLRFTGLPQDLHDQGLVIINRALEKRFVMQSEIDEAIQYGWPLREVLDRVKSKIGHLCYLNKKANTTNGGPGESDDSDDSDDDAGDNDAGNGVPGNGGPNDDGPDNDGPGNGDAGNGYHDDDGVTNQVVDNETEEGYNSVGEFVGYKHKGWTTINKPASRPPPQQTEKAPRKRKAPATDNEPAAKKPRTEKKTSAPRKKNPVATAENTGFRLKLIRGERLESWQVERTTTSEAQAPAPTPTRPRARTSTQSKDTNETSASGRPKRNISRVNYNPTARVSKTPATSSQKSSKSRENADNNQTQASRSRTLSHHSDPSKSPGTSKASERIAQDRAGRRILRDLKLGESFSAKNSTTSILKHLREEVNGGAYDEDFPAEGERAWLLWWIDVMEQQVIEIKGSPKKVDKVGVENAISNTQPQAEQAAPENIEHETQIQGESERPIQQETAMMPPPRVASPTDTIYDENDIGGIVQSVEVDYDHENLDQDQNECPTSQEVARLRSRLEKLGDIRQLSDSPPPTSPSIYSWTTPSPGPATRSPRAGSSPTAEYYEEQTPFAYNEAEVHNYIMQGMDKIMEQIQQGNKDSSAVIDEDVAGQSEAEQEDIDSNQDVSTIHLTQELAPEHDSIPSGHISTYGDSLSDSESDWGIKKAEAEFPQGPATFVPASIRRYMEARRNAEMEKEKQKDNEGDENKEQE